MAIIGVGFSEPEATQSWAEDQGYAFEIWTDTNRTLAITYGAAENADAYYPSRVTVVLDGAGELLLTYEVSEIGTHPSDVLSDVTLIFGGV